MAGCVCAVGGTGHHHSHFAAEVLIASVARRVIAQPSLPPISVQIKCLEQETPWTTRTIRMPRFLRGEQMGS